MIFIKKHYFGVTIEMAKALLVGWDIEWERGGGIWKREISCLEAAVVVRFCGGFWEE